MQKFSGHHTEENTHELDTSHGPAEGMAAQTTAAFRPERTRHKTNEYTHEQRKGVGTNVWLDLISR